MKTVLALVLASLPAAYAVLKRPMSADEIWDMKQGEDYEMLTAEEIRERFSGAEIIELAPFRAARCSDLLE